MRTTKKQIRLMSKPVQEINRELLEALNKIANWELPATGKFWDKEETQPTSYETEYGSNGARDYMKSLAKAAIKKATE